MEKASKTYLKQVRELLREKDARRRDGIFVAEGRKVVHDLIAKGHSVDSALVSADFMSGESELSAHLEAKNVPVFHIGNTEFNRVSSLKSPQGVIAILKEKHCSLKRIQEHETRVCRFV